MRLNKGSNLKKNKQVTNQIVKVFYILGDCVTSFMIYSSPEWGQDIQTEIEPIENVLGL